jgi:hypothetical protein
MTIEEFDKTGFTGQMKCEYKGKEYDIVSIGFEERIIAINELASFDDNGANDLDWKRCENVKLLQT